MRFARILALLITLPLLAAGHDVTPPTYGPTPYAIAPPVVASNGETFLTLWTLTTGGAGPFVFGSLADARGNLLTPVSFVVTQATKILQVFGSGKNYVALLTDASNRVRIATIDGSGHLIAVTPTAATLLPYGFQRAAFNGDRFFLTDIDYARPVVIAHIIDLSGHETVQVLWKFQGMFDVVATWEGFAGVMADASTVYLQRFDRNGVALSQPMAFAAGGATMLNVATNGSTFVVAWTPPPPFGSNATNLNVAVLRPDGVVIGSSSGPLAEVSRLTMLWNGASYVLVGQSVTGAFASRIDDHGKLLDGLTVIPAGISAAAIGNSLYATGPVSFAGTPALGSAVTVDAAGVRSAEARTLTTTLRRQAVQAIGTDGVDFLPVWLDDSRNDELRSLARVNASGVPIDNTQIDVGSGGLPSYSQISVAFGASVYLLAWDQGTSLFARRMLPNGTFVDAQPIVITRELRSWGNRAIAWDGQKFLIVWTEQNPGTGRGIFMGEGGDPSTPINLQTPFAFATTWNGQNFLVASYSMSGTIIPEGPFISGVQIDRLTRDGARVDSVYISGYVPEFHMASGTASESLAVTEREASYREGNQLLGYAIHTGERMTVDAPFTIFKTFSGIASDIAWNGTSYTVAWHAGLGDRWWLSTARVTPSKTVANPITVPTAPPDVLRSPAIAVNRAAQAVIALSEVKLSDGVARTRTYAESELQPMPPPPSTPTVTSAIANAGSTTVTWESDGSNIAGFSVESVVNGLLQSFAFADGTERSATILNFKLSSVRVVAFGPGGVSQPSATVTVTSPTRRRAIGK